MKTLALLALAIGATLVACSGDDTTATPGTDGGATDASARDTGAPDATADAGGDAHGDSGGDAGPPAPPALGMQIDRMGRPAINTATNHTFDTNDAAKGAAKDAWNQNANPAMWSQYVAEIEANLAILDAIDGTCGNQLFANAAAAGAARYGTLAGVLADDRLWVNAAGATCTTYLAVEANATGLVTNADCGGRVPGYDVMKITYSAVAIGALSGVTDGTTAAAKSKVTTFPYLAPPQ